MEVSKEDWGCILKKICSFDEASGVFEDNIEFIKGVGDVINSLSLIILKQPILQTQIALLKLKQKQQEVISKAVKQEDIDKAKGIIACIDFYIGNDTTYSKVPAKQQLIDYIVGELIDADTVYKWSQYQIQQTAEEIYGYYAAHNFSIRGKQIQSWRGVVRGWLRNIDHLPNLRDITEIRDVYNSLE